MGYWNSRGLKGSTLENMINLTNDVYREDNLAIIQKVPTPITPVKIDKSKRTITLAYFEQKSTVDYIGAVQGIPVCFDAKETTLKRLPLQNIHKHQIEFMESFELQKGIAFLLVHFIKYQEYYYLPLKDLKNHWVNAQNGGRKSIAYNDFDKNLIVRGKNSYYIHYLEPLNKVLQGSKT